MFTTKKRFAVGVVVLVLFAVFFVCLWRINIQKNAKKTDNQIEQTENSFALDSEIYIGAEPSQEQELPMDVREGKEAMDITESTSVETNQTSSSKKSSREQSISDKLGGKSISKQEELDELEMDIKNVT